MKRVICSRQWTDVNIRLGYNRIMNCCKSWQDEPYTPAQIKQMGNDFIANRPENIADKKYMIDNDALPPNCGECLAQFPGGHYAGNNIWLDHDWQPHEVDSLMTEDHTNFIELMVGTTCNMACMYCGAKSSTTWADVLQQPRIYGDPDWREAVLQSVYKYLNTVTKPVTFHITGGEPLLEPSFFDVLTEITKNCTQPIQGKHAVMLTSNLNVKPKLLERFFDIIQQHPQFQWALNASCDKVEDNIIRDRLDWEKFDSNFKSLSHSPLIDHLCIGPSISHLSIPTHHKLVEYAQSVLENFPKSKDIANNAVYHPQQMSLVIAPKYYRDYVEKAIAVTKFEKHKQFLEACYHNVGIERNPTSIAQAKQWFEQQAKLKNINYLEHFPDLEKLLDNNIE